MRLQVSGLIRLNLIPPRSCRALIESDRAGDDCQAQMAALERTCGHQAALSGRQA